MTRAASDVDGTPTMFERMGTMWNGRRRIRWSALAVTFLSLLFVASSAQAAVPVGPTGILGHGSAAGATAPATSTTHAPAVSSATHASAPSLGHATPPPSAPSSGRATFFNTTMLPYVPSAYQSCAKSTYYTSCYNSTSEPSINMTSTGLIGVAYTAYTNITDCPQFLGFGNGTTEVAFASSSNLGASWSSPLYMDNPVCTGYGGNFSSAAQPSLTSLANGTLVMAYEEYNLSCGLYCYYPYVAPYFYCYYTYYDRIVVSESYDNGTTWTTPTVLDSVTNDSGGSCPTSSYPDLMPRVTAFGQTIYVAWTNYTMPYLCGGSSGIGFVASTDGGSTWTSPAAISPVAGSSQCYPTNTWSAGNPNVIVLPDGTLHVVYVTALGYNYNPYVGKGKVIDASSTNNGTTFTYSTVSDGVWMQDGGLCCANSVFMDVNPALAYGASTGQLFVAWNALSFGNYCAAYYSSYTYCGNNSAESLFIANSTDNGASWNTHMLESQTLQNPNNGPWNQLYLPAIAVTTDGTLHLQAAFENDSICGGIYGYCGAIQEIYLNSTDNGSTWSQPVLVYSNWTTSYPDNLQPGWPGEFATMLPVGNSVYLAWTLNLCTFGYCDWQYGTPGTTSVMISQLYTGVGLTLTFTETGLATGTPWLAEVMGNFRSGLAPASLSVSGIPPAATVAYSVPWYNQSWGVAWSASYSPSSPGSFTKNTTISATFSELVRFTVNTVPTFQYYCWLYNECSNWAMSPIPSSTWVTAGTPQSITLTNVGFYTYCYGCDNMSFDSWTGTGAGNYTGLSPNITVTPNGPVNETASFTVLGYCWSYPTLTCWNTSYTPVTFVEDGLPANVTWEVTVLTQNGTVISNSTAGTDIMSFLLPDTPSQYWVWTVPDASGGEWVPTTDAPSTIQPISNGLIHVHFTLTDPSTVTFPTRFVEEGLPSGTPWSLEFNGASYGVQSNNTTVSVMGGGPYSVNASTVYLENGYAYYASDVSWSSYTLNSTDGSSAVPGAINITGPGVVTIDYSPMYLLTTSASVGGSVTPNTNWYAAGTHIQLNETASAGYHFVSWVGSGSGATTATQDATPNPTITPTGPVTEAATFRPNPLPTWNLTVVPVGLPVGTPYLVTIGTMTYAATGTFKVGEISNGNYAVAVPYSYLNGTSTTRFVAGSVTSDLTFTTGGVLEITSNGTLTLSFTTQYLLTLSATPSAGGTISPSPGAYWENASDVVALTATPTAGYLFAGWNGTGTSLVMTESTSLTMSAPMGVTAQFTKRPIGPPAVYWASITETGLPTGVAWNVSLGDYGASGHNGTLTVNGLNGSYTLSVPAVLTAPGVRYVPNVTGVPEAISANWSLSVGFSEQFLVTVTAGLGGAVTPSDPTWVASGQQIQIQATANGSTMSFANWTGTGSGSYTGPAASDTLVVNAPISEEASFVPVYHAQTTTQSSGSSGMGLALALLVGLLVVGLVAGLLIGRRRGGASSAPPQEWHEAPEGAGSEMYAETPETHEGTP